MNERYHEGWGQNRPERIQQGLEALIAGEVRWEIPCDQARRHWFSMARRMYVGNDPEPDLIPDLETGIHIGSCPTAECQSLAVAYQQILHPSHPDATELLADVIDQLEASMLPPPQES